MKSPIKNLAEYHQRSVPHERIFRNTAEFRTDLNIARLIDAAVGAVYIRLLFGQALDPDWARDLTETLLRGCR